MKRFISLALVFVLLASSFAFAAEASEPVKAEGAKTFQEVYLDGGKVDLGAYLINQRNYVKLRDVAALLTATDAKFNVGFENKKVVITTGETYEKLDTDLVELPEGKVEALMGEQAFIFNGEEKMVKTALINQNNYLQLRELGELIGFGVHYNKETRNIELSSKVEEKAEEAKDENAEEKVEPFVNETGVELNEEAKEALVKAIEAEAAAKELGEVKNITVNKIKQAKKEDKVVYEYDGTITTAEKTAKFEAELADDKFAISFSEIAEKIEKIKEKIEEKAEEIKEKAEEAVEDAKDKVEEIKDNIEEKVEEKVEENKDGGK